MTSCNERSFARTWYEWLRIPRPFEHYRHGNTRHSLYILEVELDHVDSYVRAWYVRLGGGETINTSVFQSEIELLAKLEQVLESKSITDEDMSAYKRYIDTTIALLKSMMHHNQRRM